MSVALGDAEWRRIDGTRPARTNLMKHAASKPGHHLRGGAATAKGNPERKNGSLLLTEDCRAMRDDYAGIAVFDAAGARKCRAMGLRRMRFPPGVLPDGVKVYAHDPENAPMGRR